MALIIIAVVVFGVRLFKLHIFPNISWKANIFTTSLSDVSRNFTGDVILISYADGKDVHLQNQNALAVSAVNKGIDVIKIYRNRNIDSEFRNKNNHILKQSRGSGFWLWKPYFILKTLEEMKEGDILVYLDSGFYIKNDITSLINRLGEGRDILFVEGSHKNYPYTKRDAAVLMGMDEERYLNGNSLLAGFLIIKNTAHSRALIKKWLEYAEDERILTDKTSENPNYPDFIDHRHDQSILSLLFLLENPDTYVLVNQDELFKDFVVLHRRRNSNKALFLPD